jgi:hypothetical protein
MAREFEFMRTDNGIKTHLLLDSIPKAKEFYGKQGMLQMPIVRGNGCQYAYRHDKDEYDVSEAPQAIIMCCAMLPGGAQQAIIISDSDDEVMEDADDHDVGGGSNAAGAGAGAGGAANDTQSPVSQLTDKMDNMESPSGNMTGAGGAGASGSHSRPPSGYSSTTERRRTDKKYRQTLEVEEKTEQKLAESTAELNAMLD